MPEMTHSGQRRGRAEREPADLRVLVCHQDELVLLGCRAVLGHQPWVTRCMLAKSTARAAELAIQHRPQLLLLHLGRSETAPQVIATVQTQVSNAQVVLITEPGRFSEADARTVGAATAITSPVAAGELIELARRVARGERLRRPSRGRESVLSQRERQVLSFLATGATNREISTEMVLAPDTIKNHVSRAYRKLGARNRLEAVNRARDLGLIA